MLILAQLEVSKGTPLADYGIALFSIGSLLIVVLQHLKFMRTYATQLTEAQTSLTCAINEMMRHVKDTK